MIWISSVNRQHVLTQFMRANSKRAARQISTVRPVSLRYRLVGELISFWASLGLFPLAVQLCEPVGGTIAVGLANLSSCAVSSCSPDPFAMLIVISNQV